MTVNVNIGGTTVPVEVDEQQVADLRNECLREFADSIINEYIRVLAQEKGETLTDEEQKEVLARCSCPDVSVYNFVEPLVAGKVKTTVSEEIDSVIAARAKFYRVTMRATQEFDIWVKATDQWEAKDYASELSYHDLSDYLEDYDHEFEPIDVDPREHDSVGFDDFFDSQGD